MQRGARTAAKRTTTSLIVTVLAVAAIAAGGQAATPGTRSGGTLRIAYNLEGTATGGIHLDPTKAGAGGSEVGIELLLYDSLYRLLPSGKLVPSLASDAKVVDDHTIAVTIRRGVTFSEGTPFDANAVKAALDRNLAATQSMAFARDFYRLTSVEVTGDHALTLHFDDPVAGGWFHFLSGIETLVPLVKSGTDLDTEPVGAGPYVLTKLDPTSEFVFEKNPKYWDRAHIKIGTIRYVNALSDPAVLNLLRGGQVDFAVLPIASVPAVQHDPSLKLGSLSDSNQLVWIPVCKSTAPLDNVRVRQGLSYAIDRKAISKAVFLGRAAPASGLWPDDNVYMPADLRGKYAYNPRKAKQLLRAAGFKQGLKLTLMPIDALSIPPVAEVIQQEWKAIGVDLTIVPSSNFVNDLYIEHRAAMGLVPVQPVPKTRAYLPGNVGDLCTYHDPKIDAIQDRLLAAPEGSADAIKAWSDLEHVVVNQALSIFVMFRPVTYATTTNVKGLKLVPGLNPYPYLWDVSVR
ncbi:MAG: ABC transporter substrate-binding protein [Actinobacteria bacterium]|nr:MAG: ABC transporter substrate-binding protein [Actinomycetota bacterium]